MNLAEWIQQTQWIETYDPYIEPLLGAGAFILDQNNRLLVVKGPVKWSLPKGHISDGEQPHETAMREIFEETSLQIIIKPRHRAKIVRQCVYYYVLLTNVDQIKVRPLDINEISEVRWCHYHDLTHLDCNVSLRYFITYWPLIMQLLDEQHEEFTVEAKPIK